MNQFQDHFSEYLSSIALIFHFERSYDGLAPLRNQFMKSSAHYAIQILGFEVSFKTFNKFVLFTSWHIFQRFREKIHSLALSSVQNFFRQICLFTTVGHFAILVNFKANRGFRQAFVLFHRRAVLFTLETIQDLTKWFSGQWQGHLKDRRNSNKKAFCLSINSDWKNSEWVNRTQKVTHVHGTRFSPLDCKIALR